MELRRRRGRRPSSAGSQERTELLQWVTDQALILTGGQATALCLFDHYSSRVRVAAGTGPFAAQVGEQAPVSHRLPGRLLESPGAVTCQACDAACCPFAPPYSHHHLAMPIQAGNGIRGALCATSTSPGGLGQGREPALLRLGQLAGSCLANGDLCRVAAELGAMMAQQKVAADLHDGIAQSLVTLQLQFESALGGMAGHSLPQELLAARDTLAGATGEVRTMIEALRSPRELAGGQQGLAAAVHAAVRGAHVPTVAVSVRDCPDFLVPAAIAAEVQRIIAEALINASRHARASAITIGLRQEDQQTVVTVADNGHGIADGCTAEAPGGPPRPPRAGNAHFGIEIMRLRAVAIGGRLEIRSAPGHGTEVILRWPEKP